MKKGFKKVCIGVAVASTVTTLITPSISLAAGNTYKDGVFEGEGRGFHYLEGENKTTKIKVNVSFENDNIENVDLVGVKFNGCIIFSVDERNFSLSTHIFLPKKEQHVKSVV